MTTYADLQTSIASWMNRTDLTAQIPDFIRLAETRINLDLRTWQMLKTETLVQSAGASGVAVPADWLEWQTLFVNGRAIEYVSPDDMAERIAAGDQCRDLYTMLGGLLVLGPAPANDVSVDATYYARIPALENADTNWLLDAYPGVYLYASLTSGFAYVQSDQDAQQYAGAYQSLVGQINSDSTKALVSGSRLRIRARA